MFFEPLESRRLYSVSLVTGVLTITGTPAADTISVDKNAAGGIMKIRYADLWSDPANPQSQRVLRPGRLK